VNYQSFAIIASGDFELQRFYDRFAQVVSAPRCIRPHTAALTASADRRDLTGIPARACAAARDKV